MSDSEADERTCLMSGESTARLCPPSNESTMEVMEQDLVSE